MSPTLRFEGNDQIAIYRSGTETLHVGMAGKFSEDEAIRILADLPGLFTQVEGTETDDEPITAPVDGAQDESGELKEPHVFGAHAVIDEVDLVFDETDEQWVVVLTNEPWYGDAPTEDQIEVAGTSDEQDADGETEDENPKVEDVVYSGPTDPVDEDAEEEVEPLPTFDELMALKKEQLIAKCEELGIEPEGNKATMTASILTTLSELAADAAGE